MLTLGMQTIVALLLLTFGFIAQRIGARARSDGPHRDAWTVTGWVFLAYAGVYALQMAFAFVAFWSGPGKILEAYLRVSPAGNHARTVLLIVLYGLIAVVALRSPRYGMSRRLLALAISAGIATGGLIGMLEGRIDAARHFSATAVMDTFGFLVLGAVLVLSIHKDSVDRFLWACLALHATRIIVGVLYHTVFAWFDAPGSWTPPFWQMHLIRVVLISAQIAIAVHRLRLEIRGGPIRGMVPGADRAALRIS